MELKLNEDQAMLRDSAARFLRDEFAFERRAARLAGDAGDASWGKIAELGWAAATLPEDVGGLGGAGVELAVLMEEIGRALYVGPFLTNAISAAVLQASRAPAARAALARVAEGGLRVALAHGEPGGRGFLDRPACLADGGATARLSGRKRLVHDAACADLLIVTAAAAGGTALYLVAPDAAGLARRDYRTLDGGQASDLELDGVTGELLADGEAAAQALDAGLYAACIGLGAEAVGVAEAALRHSRDYVAVRRQFGQALTDFQVVQHRIADMFVELEQLRAGLLGALSKEAAAPAERRRAAIGLKILAGQVAAKIAGDGLHLHGGMGMTDAMPISHHYRRARVIESQFGNSDHFLAEYAAGLA